VRIGPAQAKGGLGACGQCDSGRAARGEGGVIEGSASVGPWMSDGQKNKDLHGMGSEMSELSAPRF
jgi:hypothetical protein